MSTTHNLNKTPEAGLEKFIKAGWEDFSDTCNLKSNKKLADQHYNTFLAGVILGCTLAETLKASAINQVKALEKSYKSN